MDKLFYRLCKGLQDQGNFYSTEISPYDVIDDLNHDYYISVYYYTEAQVNSAQETIEVIDKHTKKPKKVKRGVGKNVGTDGTRYETLKATTNKLVFDFDSEDNPDLARKDTIELISRLDKYGINPEDLEMYYSGNKGNHVIIQTNHWFNSSEMKAISMTLAKGLLTADTTVYNDSRIIRLPHTKHQKSGRFCTPIYMEDLLLEMSEIEEIGSKQYPPNPEKFVVDLPAEILEMKENSVKVEKQVVEAIGRSFDEMANAIANLDYTKKLPHMPTAKWVLHMGFIPRGYGQEARMILAATYKSMMLCEEDAYRMLKSVSERRVKITGDKNAAFDTDELWTNVISTVFSPQWQGGNYGVNHPLLKTVDELLPPYLRYNRLQTSIVVDKDEAFGRFENYAKNIDKNTIRFGIPSLDNKIRFMAKNVYGFLASPGVGKCHTKGTKILMFDGSIKNVEDVKIGDRLMGDDSRPRKVLSLARGREKTYDIVATNGNDSYGVNESHILSLKSTQSGLLKGIKKGDVINISVKDYLEKSKSFKRRMLGYRVPVEFRKRNLKYDPYILGLWIGDGTRTKPSITSVDIETQNYIRNFCDEHNFRLSITDEHRAPSYNIVNGNIGGKVNPFLDFIRSQQVNGEKRISQDYLTSCREDRLRLLAGLVDSDGHKVREGGYEIITKYPELAKQIKFLAQSLGYKCSDNIKRVQYKGELRTYRRLYISGDLRDVPVLISRKKQTKKPARTELTYGFKVIERGEDDYYGFEIDGNHLYCLGDFTVTHNTSVALQIMENTSKAGNKTTYFSFDMSLDDTYEKILIRHTGKDGDEIMRNIKDNDEEKIQQYKNILSKYYKNVDFVFKPGLSIEDMEKAIIEREEETGVPTKLVVVDYLTLIKTPGSDGNQKVIDAIQGLRFLAHNMNVCVFVLLQPNKMNSTPSEPIKSYNAIKGSSEVPEACTAILTAYREGFNPLNFDEDHYFTFICVKNRKGRLFSLDYNWRGKEGMIREMEPIERETLKELRAMKKEEAEEQRQRWTSDRNGRSPI